MLSKCREKGQTQRISFSTASQGLCEPYMQSLKTCLLICLLLWQPIKLALFPSGTLWLVKRYSLKAEEAGNILITMDAVPWRFCYSGLGKVQAVPDVTLILSLDDGNRNRRSLSFLYHITTEGKDFSPNLDSTVVWMSLRTQQNGQKGLQGLFVFYQCSDLGQVSQRF